MTIYISSGQTTMIVAKTAGEMLLIETGATVEVPDLACDASGDAIFRAFLIRGTLSSTTGAAFDYGQTATVNSHSWMKVDDAGVVRSGTTGIIIRGGGFSLENVGKILTGGTGVLISGNNCVVTNNDTMASWGGRLFETSGSGTIITNNVDMDARIEVITSTGDGLIVTNNKSMSAESGSVVSAAGNKAIITNNGSMTSMGHVISVSGDKAIITNTNTVKSSAGFGVSISGDDAILTNHKSISGIAGGVLSTGNGLLITNYSEIEGFVVGVALSGEDARLVNHATITGGTALSVSGSDNVIENNKVLNGTSTSLAAVMLGGSDTLLTNNGMIKSASGIAVSGDDGEVTLVNRGTIRGTIDLGGGSDRFDNLGGTVTGAVSGGTGDDVFILDRAIKLNETATGGIDTIRATYSAKLTDNIENLVLIGKGATTGTGNELDNVMTGNKADNMLKGAEGSDTMSGGGGDDRLSGDGGDDVFVFKGRFGRDVVTDFADGHDRISLAGLSGFNDFQDVEKVAEQSGSDVILDFGKAGTVRLEGVSLADLDATDFLF